MASRGKHRMFRTAFSDVWGLLGIVSTGISIYFLIVNISDLAMLVFLQEAYRLFGLTSAFIFGNIFAFFDIQVPILVKDACLLYCIIGGTLARSYVLFRRYGGKDVESGVADNFVYGHSKGFLLPVLVPKEKYDDLFKILGIVVCFLLWVFIIRSKFGYMAFQWAADGEEPNYVGGADLQPIFWMQLVGAICAAAALLLLSM